MSVAALRIGRCPGALNPMMSGDGLIVRIKPRGGGLTLAQAQGVAASAARFGNGLLDLTGRANLQIRGVSEAGLPGLTLDLDGLGLLDADERAEARRNVVASPLMGLDPTAAFDIRPAVAALEAALAGAEDLAGLPAKFGFAVSDGGVTALDGVSADVRFDAIMGGRFAIGLDGDAVAVSSCAAEDLPETAVRLAGAFVSAAAMIPDLHRMRDLVDAIGAVAVAARADLDALNPRLQDQRSRQPPRFRCVGPLDLPRAGSVLLGVAAPFGRLDAAQLDTLARLGTRAGASDLRLTPWRAILVPGLTPTAATGLAADCGAAGLIVDPHDPRLRVAACAGAPGCRRATTAVLDHAARWAKLLGRGEGGIVLHVSGCAKGCAHPGPAPLTLVATHERYGLVVDGTTAGSPSAAGLDLDEVRAILKTALRWDRRP